MKRVYHVLISWPRVHSHCAFSPSHSTWMQPTHEVTKQAHCVLVSWLRVLRLSHYVCVPSRVLSCPPLHPSSHTHFPLYPDCMRGCKTGIPCAHFMVLHTGSLVTLTW